MNELADIIISKLEVKQQQWDNEFHDSIADIYGKQGHKEAFVMSEEEMTEICQLCLDSASASYSPFSSVR